MSHVVSWKATQSICLTALCVAEARTAIKGLQLLRATDVKIEARGYWLDQHGEMVFLDHVSAVVLQPLPARGEWVTAIVDGIPTRIIPDLSSTQERWTKADLFITAKLTARI